MRCGARNYEVESVSIQRCPLFERETPQLPEAKTKN